MALTQPSAHMDVRPVNWDDHVDMDELATMQQRATSGTLAQKAEILANATDPAWLVQVNGYRITGPITTWHGDPICEAHLYGVAEKERQPQTVRMAQWGPKR